MAFSRKKFIKDGLKLLKYRYRILQKKGLVNGDYGRQLKFRIDKQEKKIHGPT